MSENGKFSEIRSRTPIGDVPFSVTARVAMQLGRESISNSIVAILELVKNAYDADAETVKIRFGNLDQDNPLLVIEDNGHGMTEQQLREVGWSLAPPTSCYQDNPLGRNESLLVKRD